MGAEIPQSFKDGLIEGTVKRIQENPFKNPRVKEISEVWVRAIFDLTDEQMDKIGELWLTKILDCDEKTVASFRKRIINDEVGLKHAGSTVYHADSQGFWKELHTAAPALVREQDLEYLIENDDNGSAAWALIDWVDELYPRADLLPTKLVSNALLYK